jgi:hypothetical protein
MFGGKAPDWFVWCSDVISSGVITAIAVPHGLKRSGIFRDEGNKIMF